MMRVGITPVPSISSSVFKRPERDRVPRKATSPSPGLRPPPQLLTVGLNPTSESCCYRHRPSSSLSLGGLSCSLSPIEPFQNGELRAGRGANSRRFRRARDYLHSQ